MIPKRDEVVTKCNATPVTGKTALFCFIQFSGLPNFEDPQISHQLHVPFKSREQNATSLKLRNTQPLQSTQKQHYAYRHREKKKKKKSNFEEDFRFKQMFSRHYHNNFIREKKTSGIAILLTVIHFEIFVNHSFYSDI